MLSKSLVFLQGKIFFTETKYLIHIPRLWSYTLTNLQLEALGEIRAWLDKNVPQGFIENEITMNDNSDVHRATSFSTRRDTQDGHDISRGPWSSDVTFN